eukprot:PhM_4_TR10478/c0_g1_i1/m.2220
MLKHTTGRPLRFIHAPCLTNRLRGAQSTCSNYYPPFSSVPIALPMEPIIGPQVPSDISSPQTPLSTLTLSLSSSTSSSSPSSSRATTQGVRTPKSGHPTSTYDWSRSTTENYRSGDSDYHGPFASSRAKLDYMYHANFVRRRQQVQDDIIYSIIHNRSMDASFKERPWLLLTAGPMGVGKNHVVDTLGAKGYLPTSSFVEVDPDKVKEMLPEIEGYRKRSPELAHTLTHAESGFIAEIAALECLNRNFNVIVHGSLRNHDWYMRYLRDTITPNYPQYRTAILYVTASPQVVMDRAKARALRDSSCRHVPVDQIMNSLHQVPVAVNALREHVHTMFVVENNAPLKLSDDCNNNNSNSNNNNGSTGLILREPVGWSWEQVASIFNPNSEGEAG